MQFIDKVLGQTLCAIVCLAIEPRIFHAHEIVLDASLDKTPKLVNTFPGRPTINIFLSLCQGSALLELFLHLSDRSVI